MRRIQKMALLIFVAISTAILLSIVAVIIGFFIVGMPRALAGLGFMGIAGIGGLGPLVFRKDKGKVEYDERDKQIQQRAALIQFACAYLFTGLACMIPFFVLGPNTKIQAHWLADVFGGTGLVAFYSWSIAILSQYGWKGGECE
jgi:hypothetical protein